MKVSGNDRDIGAIFILYVADQEVSTQFYADVLKQSPSLYVSGMTEFTLSQDSAIGLMPEKGIKNLLGKQLPNPELATGVPRSEIYLYVDNPDSYHQRALTFGAKELSPLKMMDWGDKAAYSLDPDGHVLVFAKRIEMPD